MSLLCISPLEKTKTTDNANSHETSSLLKKSFLLMSANDPINAEANIRKLFEKPKT
jgi:hypothetical protein